LNNLPRMMHIARELCGGQICVTPDAAVFEHPETRKWMDKYYTINDEWQAEDRRKLLALARDALNSDYAGHRLTFQLFAQSPPFAQSAAVYRTFDWNQTLKFAQKAGGLSDNIWGVTQGRGIAAGTPRQLWPPPGAITITQECST
jgi:4-hydroxyphenylacetate 3-monooxygenase